MSTADKVDNEVSVCANCGKEGSDINNTCNKCKQVKYCNAACKKKHRSKHKKQCEEHIRLAAEKHNEELRRAAEKHDLELFKRPPPEFGDCPICLLLLPTLDTGRTYMNCCGKTICSGCEYAPVYDNQGNEVDEKNCPFCRAPTPTSNKEHVKRIEKRIEVGDAEAMHCMGTFYGDGECGLPRDYKKALALHHRAAELGYAKAYNSIGYAYDYGNGVKRDPMKAMYYYELAAKGGSVLTRHNLGIEEEDNGNTDRALMHYMIAVESGLSESLKCIQQLYTDGEVTKECYMKALQAYQTYLGEIKSVQRDKAAAAHEDYRYY